MNPKQNLPVLILLLGLVFLPNFVKADLIVQLENNGYVETFPGTSLIINGTMINTSSTTPVYFTSVGDLALISTNQTSMTSGVSGDNPISFGYLPHSLAPGQPYQGPLIKINVDANAINGDYFGDYSLFGGDYSASTSPLATKLVTVHIAPADQLSSSTVSGGLQIPSGLQMQEGLPFQSQDSSQLTTLPQVYTNGPRTIMLEGDPTVYWVSENNIKIAMLSPNVFLSYGNKWEDIQTVGQSEFDYYKPAKFIWLNGTGAIYFIDSGVKRIIPSSIWNNSGIDATQVIFVNKTDFNSYKTGSPITSLNEIN